MKPKIPDDLLSAFLDREATPDEEVLARKYLQTSPQAKQQLQDYQRLGELLHELPRRTAPTEFAAAVMQQAERETLIPLETAGSVPVGSQSERPSRRGWIVATVGVVATAATVLVAVNLAGHKNATGIDAVAVRETNLKRVNRSEPVAPTTVALAEKAPSASAERESVSPAKVAAAAAKPALQRPSSAIAASPAPPTTESFGITEKMGGGMGLPAFADAGKSQMVFPAELKSLQEGDVVEALESVGDQVAVVRLTLVNQTAGLGGLQNLLVRDASRPVRGAEKDKLMKERFAQKKGSVVVDAKTVSNKPGELICVFVEGSRDELVSVLKDVQNQSQVQHAQLTNGISAAKLAEYAHRPVTTASLGGERSAARAQTLSLPHAAVDKIVAGATTGSRQQSKAVQPAEAQVAQNSKAIARRSRASEDSEKRAFPAQQSIASYKGQTGQADTKTGKQLIAGIQRSYQVFFVLDDQSVTESKDKAPAVDQAKLAPEAPPAADVRRRPVRAKRPARKRVVRPAEDAE